MLCEPQADNPLAFVLQLTNLQELRLYKDRSVNDDLVDFAVDGAMQS